MTCALRPQACPRKKGNVQSSLARRQCFQTLRVDTSASKNRTFHQHFARPKTSDAARNAGQTQAERHIGRKRVLALTNSHRQRVLPTPSIAVYLSSRVSCLLLVHRIDGSLMRSLNKKVPYTRPAKPTTWSHLKVSQPRPRDTIQMKSVRQVSMVDLDVAETDRVTERPKKLKPLQSAISEWPPESYLRGQHTQSRP